MFGNPGRPNVALQEKTHQTVREGVMTGKRYCPRIYPSAGLSRLSWRL
jgi:hypothetical protein